MKRIFLRSAQVLLSVLALLAASTVRAVDTTPPTLLIRQSWIEKIGGAYHFKMNLDPQDDVGVDRLEFRTALNTTAPLPANKPWSVYAWNRGQPFDEIFVCTAIVIEIRAVDAAGNASPLQRRTFKSPFPVSAPPNLDPVFSQPPLFLNAADTTPMDCKGVFAADFDGQGRDDVLTVDNATGVVTVHRQGAGVFTRNTLQLAAGTMQDSAVADFDGDGQADLVVVANHDVVQYHNDGLGSNNTLTFSPITPPARTTSGVTTVEHIGVGDFTGDGHPEVIIVGTGDNGSGGSVVKAEVMVNDGAGSLYGCNTARGPTGATAGRIAIGDLTADGKPDVAMIDKQGERLVVFKWINNAVLGGMDNPTVANRPLVKDTYFGGVAVAIGDIQGTGHNAVVLTEHYFGTIPQAPYNDGQKHHAEFFEPFVFDASVGLQSTFPEYLSVGPPATVEVPFVSDIMIRDFTNDRFPELVITSEFDGGIRTVRLSFPLDANNLATYGHTTSIKTFPAAPHPQRLAAARYGANTKYDAVIAGADVHQVAWLSSNYTETVKSYELVTGVSTDSDPNGSQTTSGAFAYTAFPNDIASYSFTYVNNTSTDLTNAVVECLLPATLEFAGGSPGCTLTTSGTSHYVRWTVNVPANSAGVETLRARVIPTTPGTSLVPTATFKNGTAVLAKSVVPKITISEPLLFTLAVSSDSDNTGTSTHKDEAIKYELTVRNRSSAAISAVKLGAAFPSSTSFLVASTPPGGTSYLLRGKAGKETGIDWTIASLPAGGLVSVFVLVNVTGNENSTITQSSATCTRGTTKITAPAFKTAVLPTLAVELSQSQNIARPGDPIDYQFTVHNYGIGAINAARLVFRIPDGMAVTAVRTDAGTGNFTDVPLVGDNLTLGTNPSLDSLLKILTWTWSTLPAHAQRTVMFTCQIQVDAPPFHYDSKGVIVTNGVVGSLYNFAGTPGSGVRLFAAKPLGGSAASSVTAPSALLLSAAMPSRTVLLSGGDPIAPPDLSLQKTASGDGSVKQGNEFVATVLNDPAVANDGVFRYQLTVANSSAPGTGAARAVQVHDFIPAGGIFLGFVRKNGNLVSSYLGYHFYDAADKEIPGGGESFTDGNNNGVWNAGEVFVDANGNHKYDGITAIRSFTFPAGDLAMGQGVVFEYNVQTTLLPGGVITSSSGGIAEKVNVFSYEPVDGYQLTASNLYFPVDGGPRQLRTLITAPAVFHFPGNMIRSRGEALGNEFATVAIPLEVQGAAGVDLSGIKMDMTIPKGFVAQSAQLLDATGALLSTPVAGNANSLGERTLSFVVGGLRNVTALFRVGLDPANVNALKNAAGEIKAPLAIKPKVTGSYRKNGGVTSVHGPGGAVLGQSKDATVQGSPVDVPMASVNEILGSLSFRADPAVKDSKIFVGRMAPATVHRGGILTYTIFVGNLTNVNMSTGSVSMSIPAGTTFVSATKYAFNRGFSDGVDEGTTLDSKPVVSGGKITWNIGILTGAETGSVSVTVKVPATFAGNRIDDNSCVFDVVNATGKTPGPLGVVVLSGNEPAQSGSATQGAVEGVGMAFTDEVRGSFNAHGFKLGNGSHNVTVGGCDVMTLTNGVLLVETPLNRVLMVGPADKISATDFRLLQDGPMRVAAGNGGLPGGMSVAVSTLPGLAGVPVVTPNSLFTGLSTNSLVAAGGGNIVAAGAGNIVAAGAGNIVAAGAGNIVAAGAGNLIGHDGASLSSVQVILPDALAAIAATSIGGKMITDPSVDVVAAGAGNIVAAGAGNIVAAGAGNLIGHDGASLIGHDGASVVAAGAGNLIGQDGAGVVAAGAGNLMSISSGNLIIKNGISSLANIK